MKAFLIVFVVLILAGAAVFFVGWVQLLIPAGSYVVIHSKTRGYEHEVVESGRFVWRVERLLPTNMKLYRFIPEAISVDVPVIRGVLPSGELYATVMESIPDFSYEIAVRVLIDVKPQALPRLVEEEELQPDGLTEWLQKKAHRVGFYAAGLIRDDPFLLSRTDFQNELLEKLSRESEFSGVQVRRIEPVRVRVPDPELYELAKNTYFRVSNAREARDLLAIEAEETNMKVLKEYAELLTEYPVLLDFLYLKELNGEGLDILDLKLPESFTGGRQSGD